MTNGRMRVIGFGLALAVLSGCAEPVTYQEDMTQASSLMASNPERAYRILQRLSQQRPDDIQCRQLCENARLKAISEHVSAGRRALSQGKLDEATLHFSGAQHLGGGNASVKRGLESIEAARTEAVEMIEQSQQNARVGQLAKARELLAAARRTHKDSPGISKAESLVIYFEKANEKFKKAIEERHWEVAHEAIQLLKDEAASVKWRNTLQKKLRTLQQADAILAQAKNLAKQGKHEQALLLGSPLQGGPLAQEWQSLHDQCANHVISKVQGLVEAKQWRSAWFSLRTSRLKTPKVQALGNQIAKELGPKCKERGLALLHQKDLPEAARELAIAGQVLPDDTDVEEGLKKCIDGLVPEYRKNAAALLEQEMPGQALTYAAAACWMSEQKLSESPEVRRCLNAIRQRTTIEMGLAKPQNASFDPSLGPRLIEGVFLELWNRKVRALSVFDERRWQQRMLLQADNKGNAKRLVAEITVYPVRVYTRECLRTEQKKYQAGTVRMRNPEWDDFARRREVLEARELTLKQEERGYKARSGESGISGLAGAAGNLAMYGTGPVGWGVAAASAAGGLGSMLVHGQVQGEVRSDLSITRSELRKARKGMDDTEAFVDEPVYKEFADNRQYFYKTARGRCNIKLIDVSRSVEVVISAREAVQDALSSDRYVHGNLLAGVRPDPKDLPPDGEMTEEALEKLIKSTADDIEFSLGQIFLGYCARAAAADKAKDLATAIEESVNFLASGAAKTHLSYVPPVAAYFDGRVADLIPWVDPAKGKWAKRAFALELKKGDVIIKVPTTSTGQTGILIVYENRGTEEVAGTVADDIAAELRKQQRSVVVKSMARFEGMTNFSKSRSENLLTITRKEKRRVALGVVAGASVTGQTKAHGMTLHDAKAELEIVIVDGASGEVLFDRSARATSRHMDETSAKKAALGKALEKLRANLLATVRDVSAK